RPTSSPRTTRTAACSWRSHRAADVDRGRVGEVERSSLRVGDLAQLALQLGPTLVRRSRDEADRQDPPDEAVRVELPRETEVALLHGAEERTLPEILRRVVARGPPCRNERLHQLRDFSLELVALVAVVPQQRNAAACAQHAMHFRKRLVEAEPVEPLADRDR